MNQKHVLKKLRQQQQRPKHNADRAWTPWRDLYGRYLQTMVNQPLQFTYATSGTSTSWQQLAIPPSMYPYVSGVAYTPPETPEIPDETEPVLIRGWREYTMDGQGPLQGRFLQRWPGTTMQAQCTAYLGAAREFESCERHLRAAECQCGIYVLKERPERGALTLNIVTGEIVTAEVVGWGAYVEYERGWRCQYVRIERLYVPDTIGALRKRYSVPVELMEVDRD